MISSAIRRYFQFASWAIVLPYLAVSCVAERSDGLTIFGDIAQFLLVCLLTFACFVRVTKGNSRSRVFWALMGIGSALWAGSQLTWSYYEILKRTPAPNAQLGDILLFMHVVPMTAALLFAPHKRHRVSIMSSLSIAMLVAWWIYVYAFTVVPWIAVVQDTHRYRSAFTVLYAVENLVAILGLALLIRVATGDWKRLYTRLIAFWIIYTVNSAVLDKVISRGAYYTGSLYDALFLVPVAWLCMVIMSHPEPPQVAEKDVIHEEGEWTTRVSVAGLLSVPLFGLYSLLNKAGTEVRDFRILISFVATIVISGILLTKLRLLRVELISLVAEQNKSVVELQRTQSRLLFQASHDPMTGALNRGALYAALEGALSAASVSRSSLSVLMIDLDHFKDVNDMYGHSAGDLAIQRAIAAVRTHTRETDIVGRYGGEEFVVALPECDEKTAAAVAERIRDTIERDIVFFNGVAVRFTTSIGITAYKSADTVDEILRRADLALYSAKNYGRNRVQLLDECRS